MRNPLNSKGPKWVPVITLGQDAGLYRRLVLSPLLGLAAAPLARPDLQKATRWISNRRSRGKADVTFWRPDTDSSFKNLSSGF